MSTELESTTPDIFLTRFGPGKDLGLCIQVTRQSDRLSGDYIQLTREEAASLADDLRDFAEYRERDAE